MARISRYPQDNDLKGSDKLIGTDEDGLATKTFTLTSLGEWLKYNTQPIATLTSADGTQFIVATTNDGAIQGIPLDATPPNITSAPIIAGVLNVGETLTATPGNFTGLPEPTQVLQWQRSDDGLTGWADIAGATGTTYLLGSLDEDKYIRVEQTEENILGTATANSASTTQIQPVILNLLLDDYPNAAAAYSLRRLRAAYSGSAIKVRRVSDNALQDIGFVNNELDIATLESFCSGTDGLVTTWYDQSGNGNNVTQTIAFEQPIIVSFGTVIMAGGKPSIDFKESQYFNYGSIAFGYDANIVIALRTGNASPTGIFAVQEDSRANTGIQIWNHTGNYTSWNSTTSNVLKDNEQALNKFAVLQAGRNTSSQSYMRINGVDYSTIPSTQDTGLRDYYIGTIRANNYFYRGVISEFIVYNQNMYSDIADIETNINDFYSIY